MSSKKFSVLKDIKEEDEKEGEDFFLKDEEKMTYVRKTEVDKFGNIVRNK